MKKRKIKKNKNEEKTMKIEGKYGENSTKNDVLCFVRPLTGTSVSCGTCSGSTSPTTLTSGGFSPTTGKRGSPHCALCISHCAMCNE